MSKAVATQEIVNIRDIINVAINSMKTSDIARQNGAAYHVYNLSNNIDIEHNELDEMYKQQLREQYFGDNMIDFNRWCRTNKMLIQDVCNQYKQLRDIVVNKAPDIVLNVVIHNANNDVKTKRSDKFAQTLYSQVSHLLKYQDRSMEDLYTVYVNNRPVKRVLKQQDVSNSLSPASPWRSPRKIKSFAHRNNWTYKQELHEIGAKKGRLFDKHEAKRLYLHIVAKKHSFVIDYFFPGMDLMYLIAINVNTRKAYAILNSAIRIQNGRIYIPQKDKKNTQNAINDLQKLMSLTTVKHIIHDKECAFASNELIQFCKQHGISQHFYNKYPVPDEMLKGKMSKTRPNHSTLALIDRLSRTIRDMNYNMFGYTDTIKPNVMQYLVDEYNASPHRTLSNVLGYSVSPNEVDNNEYLEEQIMTHMIRQNILTVNDKNYVLEPNSKVHLYNDTSGIEKRRCTWLPDEYTVVGNEGGLVKVCSKDGKIFNVSRWMLKDFYK